MSPGSPADKIVIKKSEIKFRREERQQEQEVIKPEDSSPGRNLLS